MSENQSIKHCVAYCLAQRFDINALSKLLSDSTLIRIIKGALLIEDDHSWSIVFAYGAVVHWNVSSEQQTKLHEIFQSMLNKDNQVNLPQPGNQGGRWRNK